MFFYLCPGDYDYHVAALFSSVLILFLLSSLTGGTSRFGFITLVCFLRHAPRSVIVSYLSNEHESFANAGIHRFL